MVLHSQAQRGPAVQPRLAARGGGVAGWADETGDVMLLYATLGTNDLPRAVRFYEAVMQVLGQPRLPDWGEGWATWGADYDRGFSLWLCAPFDGQPARPGNGAMLAFAAADAATVDAFHAAGLAAGGQDEGAPGHRPHYGPGFYAAYLRDPDGNKLACVCHRWPGPAAPQG